MIGRAAAWLVVGALGVFTASCAFLLDTDELQEGTGAGGADASVGGSSGVAGAGTGGAGGSSGIAGTGGADAGGASGSAGEGGSGSPIPIEDAPGAMAEAVCTALEDCLGPGMSMVFYDEDCVELLTRTYGDSIRAPFEESVAQGNAQYHADLMPACVAAYQTMTCEQTDEFPAACNDALEGLVAVGQSCSNSTECVGSAYCATDAGCPGTCKPPIALGQSCLETDVCAPGSACFEGTCQAKRQQNEDCGEAFAPCASGLICLGEDKTKLLPGTCLAVADAFTRAQGFSCDLASLSLCQDGLHCAFDNIIKMATVSGSCVVPSSLGGPCKTALPDSCPAGAYCKVTWTTTTGICALLPGNDEPCASNTGWVLKNPCQAYHRCIGEGAAAVCKKLEAIGQPCEDNAQCYSGFCGETDCGETDCATECMAPNSCPF